MGSVFGIRVFPCGALVFFARFCILVVVYRAFFRCLFLNCSLCSPYSVSWPSFISICVVPFRCLFSFIPLFNVSPLPPFSFSSPPPLSWSLYFVLRSGIESGDNTRVPEHNMRHFQKQRRKHTRVSHRITEGVVEEPAPEIFTVLMHVDAPELDEIIASFKEHMLPIPRFSRPVGNGDWKQTLE